MATHLLRITEPRPYFAEIPYYIWGQVNYDSDGDCDRPDDRTWTHLYLRHRKTNERIVLRSEGDAWTVEGPDPAAARAAHFLVHRCSATRAEGPVPDLGADWDPARALARAARVAAVFERPELALFRRDHLFWGSFKWVGWYATDLTWVGRWILESLLTRDPRGVHLCAFWLKEGTSHEGQSAALRSALEHLTGLSFPSDDAWVKWYFEGPGNKEYPEPDFDEWRADMIARYPEME